MTIRTTTSNGISIAILKGDQPAFCDVTEALDILMSIRYETGCDCIAMEKALLPEDFFVLRTKLAGEVLQKAVNYRFRIAIFGDYSKYTSKPLQDFIYESNKGHDIFFVSSESEAVLSLGNA